MKTKDYEPKSRKNSPNLICHQFHYIHDILICQCHRQTCELCHTSKGFTTSTTAFTKHVANRSSLKMDRFECMGRKQIKSIRYSFVSITIIINACVVSAALWCTYNFTFNSYCSRNVYLYIQFCFRSGRYYFTSV